MVSSRVRLALRTGAATLVVAGLHPACPAVAQSGLAGEEEQRRLVAQIADEQSRNGPHSDALIGPLSALALLYQEHDDHALAAAAIAQALQVVRATHGLYSLEQAPLLRQSIANAEALGDSAAAWDAEQALLELARRHPADLRTVPILRELGDKHMTLLDRYLAGDVPREVILSGFRHPTHGSRRKVAGRILSAASGLYTEAIQVLLRNERYASEELADLEMRLLRSSYAFTDYHGGMRSLRRLRAYAVAGSAPPERRALSLVRIADWQLLFHQNSAAVQIYEQAYRELADNGVSSTSIAAIFAPDTPVVLPDFVPNPLTPSEAAGSSGHIDVAFEITRFGHARRIEIVDAVNATNADERRLVRLIEASRFRPRIASGELDQAVPVKMRYYLTADETAEEAALRRNERPRADDRG
ncbi:MAG TPA: hypothetical protein VIN61_07965 [Gammaproteobacteria bacterium]